MLKVKPVRPIGNAVLGIPISFPVAYERVIFSSLTAQLNASYQLQGEFDNTNYFDVGELGFSNMSLSSWKVGPEVRWYFGKKEELTGFYAQGFFNYSETSLNSDFLYETTLELGLGSNIPYAVDLEVGGSGNYMNYGLGIGKQWLFGNFCLDITWFGVGWGSGNFGIEVDGNLIELGQVNNQLAADGLALVDATNEKLPTWEKLVTEFQDEIDAVEIPVVDPKVTSETTTTSGKMNVKTPVPFVRLLNFTIGFSF